MRDVVVKMMGKFIDILRSILVVILLLCFLAETIFEFYVDPKEGIIFLGQTVLYITTMWLIMKIRSLILKTNRIEWDKYKNVRYVADGFYFVSWGMVAFFLLDIFDITERSVVSTVLYIIMFIFSVWTYFAIVFAKKYALFLLRAYLIYWIVLIGFVFLRREHFVFPYDSNSWSGIIFHIMCIPLVSLCVKGFIMSFEETFVEPFPKQKTSYIVVLFVVAVYAAALMLRHSTFTWSMNTEYPPINALK